MVLKPLIGFLIFAISIGVIALGGPDVIWIALLLGFVSLPLIFSTLFRRRQVVLDRQNRRAIDLKKDLFGEKNRTFISSFDDIRSITLDEYVNRVWEEGLAREGEREWSVSLALRDGGIHSLGRGPMAQARTVAETLAGEIGVPLEELKREDSPTQDSWIPRVEE